MSGLTLYEISDHLVSLMDTYDLCETDEQRAECNAEIERYVRAQIDKVDNFCRFLSHLESQIDLAEREIKRLKARETAFANLEERLKQYAIYTLQRMNLRKMDGDTSKLALRTNQPGVEIDNAELIPPEYKTIRQEIQIDKRGIKKAIDAGIEVPGA